MAGLNSIQCAVRTDHKETRNIVLLCKADNTFRDSSKFIQNLQFFFSNFSSGQNVDGYERSSSIELTFGQKYYMELYGEEYSMSDYFVVAMKLPDETIVYPITSNYLERYD